MTRIPLILSGLLLVPWPLVAQSGPGAPPGQEASPASVEQENITAFVDVNVLPMDRERVLEGHTVLIQDGLIQDVAPSHRVRVPEGARVIDGDGLFLLPGLADMHVTLPSRQSPWTREEEFLLLLLAHNVMVIRGMEGAPAHLELRREVASGALLGPTIWAGAPPLGGDNAQEPEPTVERMLAHRRAGYDLQPVFGDVAPEAWDSLAEEAHSRGYTFGGTVPEAVGLRKALSSGISTVEHLDGYLEEVVSDEIRARLDRGASIPLADQLQSVEGRKMRAMAAHTRASDAWIVPTLHLWEIRFGSPEVDSLMAQPGMEYVPEPLSNRWILEAGGGSRVPQKVGRELIDTRRRLLRALTMAGVGVLMGTGSPELFTVPGFSLRHELQSMRAAGLTPYEILVTGTRNVADYARRELLEPSNFGTVEEGNRADLVLLAGNPLDDLSALWDQEGIMLRGRWIPRAELDRRLQVMRERLGGQPH